MSEAGRRVFVTGGTGAVGPRVVSALDRTGYKVRVLSIDAPATGLLPQDAEVLIGDVTDRRTVQSAMRGVDAVIHMAALLHIADPGPEMRERYERINVGGTATVVEAAVGAGVPRVVLFSTVAVYGATDGLVLDETSPTRPATMYAQTKGAAERIVLGARGADGAPVGVVLRLGAVYGSRIKGNYERLAHALARRRFIAVGDGGNRRTLVYDKDAGRAAVLAASHPAAAGRVFNVTDGTFHPLREIITSICAALNRRPPRLSVPLGPTRTMIRLVEKGGRAIGLNPPVTLAMLDKYTEDVAVDGNLIQRELGFVPAYDLKRGWEESIREMRL